MMSHPSTDNNLEAFHRTFHHMAARTHVPIFLGVLMVWHYVEKCRTLTQAIESGHAQQRRRRVSSTSGPDWRKNWQRMTGSRYAPRSAPKKHPAF